MSADKTIDPSEDKPTNKSSREAILNRVRQANVPAHAQAHVQPNVQANVQANVTDSQDKAILQAIYKTAGVIDRTALLACLPESVQQRLNKPGRLTQPDLPAAITDTLIAQMESVQMSVVRLQTSADIVDAVEWYLQDQGIEGELSVAPSLENLGWSTQTHVGPATGTEVTSVTSALAAVAETGSIALASGEQTPSTLNFLPENHIVVLHESQIVERMEDVWTQVRSMAALPRAINLVTGPSRTGDIEQTIELGAHGPRRMHVLLVAGEQICKKLT